MKLNTPPKGRETVQDEDYEAKLVSGTYGCDTVICTVTVVVVSLHIDECKCLLTSGM